MSDSRNGISLASIFGTALGVLFIGFLFRAFAATSISAIWVGVLASALAMLLAQIAFSNRAMDFSPEFFEKLTMWTALSAAAFVMSSSFYWDEAGYCVLQQNFQTFEVGPQSLEDVFQGKSRSETIVSSEEKKCLLRGSADYASKNEIGALVLSSLAFGPLFLFMLLGLVLRIQEGSPLSRGKDLGKDQPVPSIADHITHMQQSLDGVKLGLNRQQVSRGHIDEFNRCCPTIVSCTPAQLRQLRMMYLEMLEILPACYSQKEIEKGMLGRRKSQLERKLNPIIQAISD